MLLAVVLFLTALPGVSAVLCVTVDGHAAIEEEGARCCLNAAGTSSRASAEIAASGSPDPCTGCVDYHLANNAIRNASSSTDRVGPMLVCRLDNQQGPAAETAGVTLSVHSVVASLSSGLRPVSLRC